MRQKGFAPIIIFVIVLLATALTLGAYYLGRSKSEPPTDSFLDDLMLSPTTTQACPADAKVCPDGTSVGRVGPNCEFAACPGEGKEWQVYTNTEYGFEISYPSSYEVLTDEENLYGWPHAVALLYNGGQAYDIVIEVWDSEEEYREIYGERQGLFVYEKADQVITVTDHTLEIQNADVVDSFKLLEN